MAPLSLGQGQDLCRRRTTSLEQSATQSQTMWASPAVTEDIFQNCL